MIARLLLVSAALSATVACGTNHTTAPTPTGADTVAATASLTGYILADSGVGSAGYHRTWNGNDTATVGDNNAYVFPSSMRAVITFALPPLPSGATLKSAVLDLTQCRADSNPFPTLGVIVADHLVPTAHPDSATYDTTAIADSVATVATAPTTTPAAIPLTSSVQADYTAGHTTTMVRLRFNLHDVDNEDVSKNVAFCQPALILTYTVTSGP